MRTHYQKRRLSTVSLVIFAASMGLIFSGNVAAQPGKTRTAPARSKKIAPKVKPPKKEYIQWNVSYTVTIKGYGEVRGEIQGEADIKWWVDRSFVGKMRLDGPTQLRNDIEVIPGWESYENYGPKADPPTVKVTIKDRLERFLEGPGEIGTHENKTEVTIWEGDSLITGGAEDATALAVNPEKRTFWVLLTVFLGSTEKNFRMSRFAVIDRSAEGYGGKPTREVTKPLEDLISLDNIPMPNGELLTRGRRGLWVVFPESQPGKQSESPLPSSYPYLIEIPKTCFKPAEPFFQGIDDTKTKVDICVEAVLTKAVQ